MAQPSDERPHRPGPGPHWEESWSLDFVAAQGRLGGFVRLTMRPAERTAWWWAYVVRRGEPLLAVREHEVDLPRGQSLEVRASGLWVDLVCETPLDHWSVGMEAFGLLLDPPRDAYRGERGQPTPVGLDLEWEASEPPVGRPGGVGYDQGGRVHGEVLVGPDRIELDGHGSRAHDWGDRDWWSPATAGGRSSIRLDDGRWFHGAVRGPQLDDGLFVSGRLPAPGITLASMLPAPVAVPAPGAGGAVSRLGRALCLATSDDGPEGWGWADWLEPAGAG